MRVLRCPSCDKQAVSLAQLLINPFWSFRFFWTKKGVQHDCQFFLTPNYYYIFEFCILLFTVLFLSEFLITDRIDNLGIIKKDYDLSKLFVNVLTFSAAFFVALLPTMLFKRSLFKGLR